MGKRLKVLRSRTNINSQPELKSGKRAGILKDDKECPAEAFRVDSAKMLYIPFVTLCNPENFLYNTVSVSLLLRREIGVI